MTKLNLLMHARALRRGNGTMLRRLAALAAIGAVWCGSALAVSEKLPWGQSSDMAAWQTFTQAVAPSGNPANHTVEFETWANDQDIYTAQPHFPAPGTPKQLQPSLAAPTEHGRPHS